MARKTIEIAKKELKEIHPSIEILSKEYINRRTNLDLKCNECGHKWQNYLELTKRTNGCPLCSRKDISNRFSFCEKKDSIGFLKPNLVIFFKNKDMAYKLKPNSNRKEVMVCPECGDEKSMFLQNLNKRGFRCKSCGDGVSLPEKLFNNLLKMLSINYESQKSFNWSGRKIYDFYLPETSTIIELHGGQHYTESFKGVKLRDVARNDYLKKSLAKKNGVREYIEIDCRKSDFLYLKNNMLINFSPLLKLKDSQWEKAWMLSQNSLTVMSWDMWEKEKKTVNKISKELNVEASTIRRYLRQGVRLGKCNYDGEIEILKNQAKASESRKRKIEQLDLKTLEVIKVYESIAEAAFELGVNHSNISKVCNGKRETAYGYAWKYLEGNHEKDIMEQSRRI